MGRLAIWLSGIVCVASLVVGPRTVLAQQAGEEPAAVEIDTELEDDETEADEADDQEFFGDSHRRRLYEESRLSSTRAVLYNLALPGVGNVYAEQYLYAGVAFSLMAFAGLFVGYGLYTDQSRFVHMGLGTAGFAYGGSIVTSLLGVREYNEELRGNLNVRLSHHALTPPSVGVGFRF